MANASGHAPSPIGWERAGVKVSLQSFGLIAACR
jgi:hypothetical protein